MVYLVLCGREVAQRGVTPLRVVPTFDEVKDRHLRLVMGLERTAVQQFAFQGGEEALGHGVVEAVAHRAHGEHHAQLFAAPPEGDAGVLLQTPVLPDAYWHRLCEAVAPR